MRRSLLLSGMMAFGFGALLTVSCGPWLPVSLPWIPPIHTVQDDRTLAAINRLRTRDSSQFRVPASPECSVLFWKRRPRGAVDSFNGFWIDVLTALSGTSHVSVDCGLERNGERWVMDSSPYDPDSGNFLDGPEYAPLRYWTGRAYARANLAGLVDSARLQKDLRGMIDAGTIRHETEREWVSLLLGRQKDDLVTCSGFIARAIGSQPDSPLAQSLRSVARKRWRWGEITPADLARAISMHGGGVWSGPAL